ncbi:MAG: hypothetical protein AB1782_02655 [Cyanobacteriota bacterium]
MAVQFSGITNTPQMQKSTAQRKVAFTAAPKADAVTFGNALALEKVATSEPAKSFVKKAIEFVTRNLGKIKDFAMKLFQYIAKPIQAIMARLKGKGAEKAAETVKQIVA